jgi:hypothetical protein
MPYDDDLRGGCGAAVAKSLQHSFWATFMAKMGIVAVMSAVSLLHRSYSTSFGSPEHCSSMTSSKNLYMAAVGISSTSNVAYPICLCQALTKVLVQRRAASGNPTRLANVHKQGYNCA